MRLPLSAALLLLTGTAAGAAELIGKERVEIVPFLGYRIGGHFASATGDRSYGIDGAEAFGGLVDVNLRVNNFKVELLWSRQQTRLPGLLRQPLDIDHFQAGIMQEVGEARARFSVSVLLGGSRLASPGLGSETRFSGSLGGSGKLFLNPHLGLRLDARAFAVLVRGGGTAICSGGCAFFYTGTALWQGEFTLGLVLAF